ncbi:T6SS phospholipase effector Tle1-like catalytic domain-containing protein [Variovorax sp. IB41]|uniref:T6SS phospholipase effector Tle1-like catalytic domain-containing protein n=1 Tax=Variovorax sp. IB41 TaxID=2779370 RepID=UPI0018E885DF|nr:DUF2235 domain-containing protein [Variovorax sp. IB41]MBJ2158578.1 DUF2235 domain-containing protein [Variovorax sp. IB41]
MSTTTFIDSALNPALGHTRIGERPLSNREQLQRAAAHCAANPSGPVPTCTGCVFVGMFFDGTGNNEQADYLDQAGAPREMRHSNVVRLYHAHPDRLKIATNGYYSYYIPGLGTPFPKIGDVDGECDEEGGLTQSWHTLMQQLGSIGAMNGAPRIVWGLTRIFNAVSRHITGDDLIDDATAKDLAVSLFDLMVPQLFINFDRRRSLKGEWQGKLKDKLAHQAVKLNLITVNVFGFSRGAAEARTFVNWLYELCEQKDGGYLFAGIPIRVQFLGLFDTVASVGAAGLYTFIEGRAGWANNSMQINPGVEQCVHMVASTEVRACFPLDSARVGSSYPANVVEYVYPGSHSDVGGGYKPEALGCKDWGEKNEDLQLARIPGYEMYCAALGAGVPFQTAFGALKVAGTSLGLGAFAPLNQMVAKALKPSPVTVKAFDAYYLKAGIQAGPVEDMAQQHLSLYFTYRVHHKDWRTSPAVKRSLGTPNGSIGSYKDEPRTLWKTQLALILVISALCDEIQRRVQAGGTEDEVLRHRYDAFTQVKDGGATGLSQWWPGSSIHAMVGSAMDGFAARKGLMERNLREEDLQRAIGKAQKAPLYLAEWRKFLAGETQAEVRDIAVERDGVRLLAAIQSRPVSGEVAAFFDELVHDSMAGFIGFGMPEFETNGYGIAKFRRTFFGNDGDAMLRDEAERGNKRRVSALDAKRASDRAQSLQWQREAAGFRGTISR